MADGPNVGYATLSVIPTLKGVRKELESQLEDPLRRSAAKAGSEAGDELQSAFASTTLIDNPDRLFTGVDTAAGRAGDDAARRLASELGAGESLVAQSGEELGRSIADGVEGGLASADLTDVGRQVGAGGASGVGDGFLGGLPDLSGGLGGVIEGAIDDLPAALAGPALAVGAGVGALVVQGVGDALAQGKLESDLEASLGVGEAQAARLGAVAGGVYRDNFGESVGQVGDSIVLVRQLFAGLGDLSDEELSKVSESALTTANVFDQDLRGSVRAAAQLIRTGLVDDSTEAFDLITKGLQGPANAADDLLDTFNEYSTQFRTLGIDGAEALGLITQGLEAGARDSDLAADAIKEFAIRAVDGSTTTADGFARIGLSSELMAAQVAAGGESARAALDATLDGLRQIEDPTVRAQAATELFGTQAEDLGAALFAMDLDTAAADLGDYAGAATDAADAADDLQSNLERVSRGISGLFADVASDALTPVADLFDGDWLSLAGVEDYVQTYLGPLGYVMPDIFRDAGADSAEAFREGLANGRGAATGAALAEENLANEAVWIEEFRGGVDLYRRSASDAADATEDWGAQLDDLGGSADFANGLLQISEERVTAFLDALDDTSTADDFLTSALDLNDGLTTLSQSIGNLSPGVDISDIFDGITSPAEDTTAVLREVLAVSDDVQQSIALALQFGGADAARVKAAGIRDDLVDIFTQAGLTQEQIEELLTVVGVSDQAVSIAIEVSGTEEAIAKLELLRAFATQPIPDAIDEQISVAISEDRFIDAANLLSIYLQDAQDELIENPLLVQILANTEPATADLDYWTVLAADKEGTYTPVGADTAPADGDLSDWQIFVRQQRADTLVGANTFPGYVGVDQFGTSVEGRRFDVVVGADLTPAETAVQSFLGKFPIFRIGAGGADGNIFTPRAEGGPVSSGDLYMVGENEPELFMSDRAGRILNQNQIRDEFSGGSTPGGTVVHNNITVPPAPDPERQGARIARSMRRKDYLHGGG